MFFAVFLLLLASVYGYPAWRLQSALAPVPLVAWAWTAATIVMALLPVALFVTMRTTDVPENWRRPIAWVVYVGLGGAIILFDVVALRDLLWGAVWLVERAVPTDLLPAAQRADWFALSALMCPGVTILLSGFAFYQARRRPPVRHVTVHIPGLPRDLDGLRIAHITDMHVGPTIRRPFVEVVVATVQKLQADLIAFTGDLADGPVAELASEVAPVARLSAPLGVWFCTGNHDYYWDARGWMAKIDALGLRLVSNGHGVVTRGDARLVVGGLPDPAGITGLPDDPRHTPDADAVFAGAPKGTRLLLTHQPAIAIAAGDTNAALILSGHTHGGQIFPWSLLVGLQQPIIAGLHRRVDHPDWIYVNRGVGYWGPPMRLGAPSEITCLTLRSD